MNEVTTTLESGEQIILTLYPDKLIWIAAIAVAAIVLMVILIAALKKRKKQKTQASDSIPATQLDAIPSGSITIGKLHAQGKRSSQQDSFFVSPAEMIPTH